MYSEIKRGVARLSLFEFQYVAEFDFGGHVACHRHRPTIGEPR